MARKISLTAVINAIRLKLQGSAPASPDADYGYLYSKTSNKHLFWKDETGTETDLMDVTASSTTTLTGKTVNLSDNTLTGTKAQFNAAMSDADFATLTGSETLTNKTLTAPTVADFTNAQHDHGDADDGGSLAASITLTTPTIADFTNAQHDHGDADDGGAALASPTITTPTISGAIVFPDNVTQTFNPGADNAGINVGSVAGDPATPDNGDIWYDSSANELTARIGGSNVALGAGGSVVDDTAYDATTWNGDTTNAPSKNAVRDKIESLVLGSSDSFKTIVVSGQSDVVADSSTDTLTLVAGSNVTITTNAGTDTITISASGSGGGRTLIAEVTPSGVSTVTVASSIVGTYKKLVIEFAIRSTQAATFVDGLLEFNADTTAGNYRSEAHRSNAAGVFHETAANRSMGTASIPGANAPSNEFAIGVIEIPQYANTGFNKHAIMDFSMRIDSSASHLQRFNAVVDWVNTSAITQIDMALSAGNFVANSVIRLYGED